MHQQHADPAGGGPTSASIFVTLNAIGQRLRKNRRSVEKHAPQALSELRDLLSTVRHHGMDSLSAHSRAAEVQVVMARAVVAGLAGQRLDEVGAYLQAASLWFDIEAEKMELNFPTTDEALSRGVLCVAIACHLLLDVRVNKAANPIPPRLQNTAHEPLHPFAFQCHVLCCRVAAKLRAFHCYEMAADYFSLAALVISDEVPFSEAPRRLRLLDPYNSVSGRIICDTDRGPSSPSPHARDVTPPPSSSTTTADAAPPSSSSPTRSTFSVTAAASRIRNASFSLASSSRQTTATTLNANSSFSGGAPSAPSESNAGTSAVHPKARGDAAQSNTEASRSGASTSVGGSGEGFELVVAPGCLVPFTIATMSEAKIACLIRDDERALHRLDVALAQVTRYQCSLAPEHVAEVMARMDAAARRATMRTERHPIEEGAAPRDEDDAHHLLDDQQQEQQQQQQQDHAEDVKANAANEPLNDSVALRSADGNHSLSTRPRGVSTTSSRAPQGGATTGAAPIASGGSVASAANSSSAAATERTDRRSADEATASVGGRSAPGGPGPQNPGLFRADAAPSAEAHLGALITLETHHLQARVLRFMLLLLTRDPAGAEALSEAAEIAALANLYRHYEQRNRVAVIGSVTAMQRRAAQAIDEAARRGHGSQGLRKASRPVSAVSYSNTTREDCAKKLCAAGDPVAVATDASQLLPNRASLRRTFAGLGTTSGAAAGAFLEQVRQIRTGESALADEPAACVVDVDPVPFSTKLESVAATLRQMRASSAAYASSRYPGLHAANFQGLIGDLLRLVGELGVGCREIAILARRCFEAMVTNPIAAIAPSPEELQAKKPQRAAM